MEIMSNIAIVTDSTAYLSTDVCKEHNIHVVPLSVVFGEEAYKEGEEITTEQFYEKMKSAATLPSTSQPAVGIFVELFEKLREEGYDTILSIHLSSQISGTYQTAISAGEMVDGVTVFGFDTEISCSPQGAYAIEAARLAKDNQSIEQIMEHLKRMKQTTRAYFMADDLQHLHRGGRMNAAQLLVGNLLKIKPILHFVEGKIVPFEKVRTEKKAINRILELLEEEAKKNTGLSVTVVHGNCPDKGMALVEKIKELYSNADVSLSYFGPVIGTHLGEGSLAVCWYFKSEN